MLTYFSNFSKDTNKAVFGERANETVFHAVLISAVPVGAIIGAGLAPLLMSLMTRRYSSPYVASSSSSLT